MFSKVLIVLAAAVAAVNAQDTTSTAAPSLPSGLNLSDCIVACVLPAAQMSNCAFTDASCVCASAQFQADAALCLTTHCTAEDLQTALALQTAQCTAAGITPSGTATPRTVPFTLASTNTATTPATSTDTATPAATSNAASGLTAGAGTVFGAVLAGVLAL